MPYSLDLLRCSSCRFQLLRFYTSMLLEIATKEDESFAPRTDVELVDAELREELAVELREEADTEAEPTRVDTKLDTSGN